MRSAGHMAGFSFIKNLLYTVFSVDYTPIIVYNKIIPIEEEHKNVKISKQIRL